MSGGPIVEPAVVRGAHSLTCPNCGGTVELRGFAHTRTATCLHCLAVIDASSPELQILMRFDERLRERPVLPIGARGTFGSVVWENIGFQVRTTWSDGIPYSWHEYLLFNPYRGFRYLTLYDGHWNFVRNLPGLPALMELNGRPVARAGGIDHYLYQHGLAQTTFVMGEFPWAIRAGEKVEFDDFVAAPHILSREANGNEFTWSAGQYIDGATVWQAFALPGAPPMVNGISPNQPSPYPQKIRGMWNDFFKLAIVWAALLMIFSIFSHNETLYSGHLSLAGFSYGEPASAASSGVFEVREAVDRLNVEVSGPEDLGPLSATLVDASNNHTASLKVHDQSGQTDIFRSGPVAPGHYTVRLELAPGVSTSSTFGFPIDLKVRRESGGTGWLWLSLVLLLIPPLVTLARSTTFESQRWAQSDPTGGSQAGGSDE